jgi:diaminopimelate epimerase
MANIYDARGNRYAVVTPEQLRAAGVQMPAAAEQAAACSARWANAAVELFCAGEGGWKQHATDGLLVGPFQQAAPFDLLIVNTDGSLAERSGNGLTIFAQSLMDTGLISSGAQFTLRVHHLGRDSGSPVCTPLSSAEHQGIEGFWLDMGAPAFGAEAVAAKGNLSATSSPAVHRVGALAAVNPGWQRSVFVRLGNPHCVSLLHSPAELPEMAWLRTTGFDALRAIAFSSAEVNGKQGAGLGDPCANGINLQWAVALNQRSVLARVFERGEGPTLSSGTSACAVASAMWKDGQLVAGDVQVEMPGGIAPIRLVENNAALEHVWLFGAASKLPGHV